MIKIENLSVAFDGTEVVKNITIEINDGEIVGEFDPKTTTPEELGLYMAGAKRKEVK